MKHFTESKKFWRSEQLHGGMNNLADREQSERLLAEFITGNEALVGKIDSVIDAIDDFCEKKWMMNLGSEKGGIVDAYLKGREIKKVLEIGGYCGYSALRFARALP